MNLASGRAATRSRGDRTAGILGWAFLITLLLSEIVLTLPTETDPAATVAEFYTAHRATVIVLQLIGFLAAGLMAAFAWRLRPVGRGLTVAGLLVAAAALTPGLTTIALALVADPGSSDSAGRLNQFLPRTDDLLFAAIIGFAVVVAVRLRRTVPWLAWLGAGVALLCLARLVLEAVDVDRGVLESLAPISFLVLIAALATVSMRRSLAGEGR